MNKRSLIATLFTILWATRVEARERPVRPDEVPAVVRAALKTKYPAGRVRSYTEEHLHDVTTYEAHIEVDGRSLDVDVSQGGRITAEEEVVSAPDLPDAVANSFRTSRFGRGQILRSERLIQNEATDNPRYELLVRDGSKRWELTYDNTGRLLTTERVRTSD